MKSQNIFNNMLKERNLTTGLINETDNYFEKETSDIIIDSLNEHVSLINEFKQRTSTIKTETFGYPDYGLELQKKIDNSLESEHELLVENMKRKLDIFSAFDVTELVQKKTTANSEKFSSALNKKPNDAWMYEYLDQISFFRSVKAPAFPEHGMNDFYFYADKLNREPKVYMHTRN